MQNDPQDPVTEDVDGLTAEERAELEADTASGGAPTGERAAAEEPAPTPTPEPTPDPEPKEDATAKALNTLAETQAQTAAALAEVTKNLERKPEPAPTPEPEAPKEPDWDAERKALKQKLEDGDLDDAAYETERELLLERKAEWKAEQRASALVTEHLQQAQQQAQEQRQADLDRQWDESMKAFMKVEANASLLADPTRVAAFNAVLSAVAQELPGSTYTQMLDEARDRTMKAFNITPPNAVDEKKVVDTKVAARKETAAPPDLSRAPAAGGDNDRGDNEFAELDDMDIDELENQLARMKPEDVERFLETAPGGLLDNPRG